MAGTAVEQRYRVILEKWNHDDAGNKASDMRPPGGIAAGTREDIIYLQTYPEADDQISR